VALVAIERDAEVGRVVEGERRRRDAERDLAVRAADPFDDVVDVEDEVARPIAAIRIARLEPESVDRVVVPGELREIPVQGPPPIPSNPPTAPSP